MAFVGSNSPPSPTSLEDTNIQITIASDGIHRLTHEPTPPVEATAVDAAITEEDERSIKQELYRYARSNAWHQAKFIYDKLPDMMRILLTARGDTALHVALNEGSTTFVEELVKLMTPQDLEIQNRHGNTAFCIAVTARNDYFCQIMMERNENLPLIRGTQDGMLPVHLAVLAGYRKVVKDLSSENLLQKMVFKDIERLFFMTIDSGRMYDILENNIGKDWGHHHQSKLLEKMCSQLQVRQLEYNKIVELMTHPSIVLIDAVKSNNFEVVKQLLHIILNS